MNILRTPDDSTAVVRIMGEFDQFLSHHDSTLGLGSPRARLTFDDSSYSAVPQNARPLTKTKIQGAPLPREREKDVEILKGRSKIAYLESQMNVLETSRKRSRVEYEKEAKEHKANLQRREEKYEDMQKSLQYVVEQENNAKDQLKDIKKEYDKYKNKAEQKMQSLQREKLKLSAELDEVGILQEIFICLSIHLSVCLSGWLAIYNVSNYQPTCIVPTFLHAPTYPPVCLYVCLSVCLSVSILCVYVCVCVFVCMYLSIYTYIHTTIHTYIHTYIFHN